MKQPDVVAGNNAFAFDLYRAVRDGGDNLIFSPYSVSLALAMTYAGARGDTAAQIARTLHFALPQDELHPALKALDESLPRDIQIIQYHEDIRMIIEVIRLNMANALWGQAGYPFRAEFTGLLEANYGAGLELVDFGIDAEAARQQINTWVCDQTEGRITDLIPPGVIDEMTRLVLCNAIYLKAVWLEKFDPDNTQDGPFTLLDGSQATVPLMTQQSRRYGFTSGAGYWAVMLPYGWGQIVMVILLPDRENFAAFEEALDADRFAEIARSMRWEEIVLTLPRFAVTSQFSLRDTLAALGMPDAFDTGRADFSGMADTMNDLYISAVIHKTFVKVDETGTEAAGITAVMEVMGFGPPPMEPPLDIRVDHPFIYAIYDMDSGAILFLGRVLNPAP